MPLGGNSQSTYRIYASFEGLDKVAAGFDKMMAMAGRAGARLEESARQGRREWERMDGMFASVYKSIERIADTKAQIGSIWRRGAADLREYTDEYMRLSQAQFKFRAIGLSESENQRAFQAVERTVEHLKGLRLDETTEEVTDLHTALGDLNHAIELLPLASKYRFSFQTLFGDKFSNDQVEKQLQGGMKSLEMMGAVAKGTDEVEKRMNVLAQMTAATGGRVTPDMMLGFAKQAGPAAQGLTIDALRSLSAPIQELGAEKTGTALMSMYKAIVTGTMNQPAKEEWVRLGLVDPKKIQFGKHSNIVKSFLPGANRLSADLMSNPEVFMSKLLEAMAHPAKGTGVDITNTDKVREELGILFPNRTAFRLASIYGTQARQVTKEENLARNAPDIEKLNEMALKSPKGQLESWEATVANFRAKVGGPMVASLTSIAEAATPIMKFFGEHESIAKWAGIMIMASKGVGMFAQSMAVLKTSGLLNLFGSGSEVKSPGAQVVSTLESEAPEVENAAFRFGRGMGDKLGRGLGSGAGVAGKIALGAALAAIPIEILVSDLMERAHDAAERNRASFELADLQKKRDQLRQKFLDQASGKPVSGDPVTPEQLAEIDRQIGGLQSTASGSVQGHHKLMYGDFATNLAEIAKGKFGAAMSGEGPLIAFGPGAMNYMWGSDRTKRQAFESEFIPTFQSGDQLKGWFEAIGSSGKYDAKELAALREMVAEKYPEFMTSLGGMSTSAQSASTDLSNFGSTLQSIIGGKLPWGQPVPYQVTGGTTGGTTGEPQLPSGKPGSVLQSLIPHKARGGMVLNPVRALIGESGPEWITPFHELRGRTARGGHRIVIHAPMTFHGTSAKDAEVVRRAVKEALQESTDEIVRGLEKYNQGYDPTI